MMTKAILKVSIDGLGKLHKTSIFPCGIFQYKKGINDKPGTPNYDLYRLALKSTSKRLYPNYANCDWSVNAAGDDYDLKVKTEYLNSMDAEDYGNLVEKLRDRKDLCEILGVSWELGILRPYKRTDDPRTLFSTMGKQELQPI